MAELRVYKLLRGRGLRSLAPGVARLWDTFLAGDAIARVELDGIVLYLHRQDEGIAGPLLNGHPYEVEERAFVERFLRPGMVFVDIGAHAGLYSCLAARRVETFGLVIAFEPEALNHQLLRRALAANLIRNVRTERVAIGDRTGEARLVRHAINHGAHHLARGGTSAGVKVALTTLDDFLARNPSPRIDLIKLDIEGLELQALRGMERTIAEHGDRMALLMEYYPALLERAGNDPAACLAHLRARGFRLWSPRGAEWSDSDIAAAAAGAGYVNIVASRSAPPAA